MSEWIMDPTQNGPVRDDIPYSEYQPSIKNLIPPYPVNMWGKRQGVNGPVMPNMQDSEYEPDITTLIPPYPNWMWNVDDYNDGPTMGGFDGKYAGAFVNCTGITNMRIPASVYELGVYTFRGSGINELTIAPDCYYFKSTFNPGTELTFYDYTEEHVNPTKVVYDIGETFDCAGAQLDVEVTDDQGVVFNRSYTKLAAFGFDSEYTGDRTLNVGRMNVRFNFDVTIDGGDYIYEDDAATLYYTGNNTKVSPPTAMYGHPLPDVELYTFMDNTQITHAIIRDGIEAIY